MLPFIRFYFIARKIIPLDKSYILKDPTVQETQQDKNKLCLVLNFRAVVPVGPKIWGHKITSENATARYNGATSQGLVTFFEPGPTLLEVVESYKFNVVVSNP